MLLLFSSRLDASMQSCLAANCQVKVAHIHTHTFTDTRKHLSSDCSFKRTIRKAYCAIHAGAVYKFDSRNGAVQGSSGELVTLFNILSFGSAFSFFLCYVAATSGRIEVSEMDIHRHYTHLHHYCLCKVRQAVLFSPFNICCIFSCNTAIFILSDQFCWLCNLTV